MGATYTSSYTRGTVSVNPGSIPDQGRGSIDVTITGVADGDQIVLYPPATLATGLGYAGCAISATDTVTIYLYNSSGGAIDDGATTWKYVWNDLTP